MRSDVLRRVRWGNVARAVGVVAAVGLIVAWPRLTPPEPSLPGREARPLVDRGGMPPELPTERELQGAESGHGRRGAFGREDAAGSGGGAGRKRRAERERRRRDRGGRGGGLRRRDGSGRGDAAAGDGVRRGDAAEGDGVRRGDGSGRGDAAPGDGVRRGDGSGRGDAAPGGARPVGVGPPDGMADGGGTRTGEGGARGVVPAPPAVDPAQTEFGIEGG